MEIKEKQSEKSIKNLLKLDIALIDVLGTVAIIVMLIVIIEGSYIILNSTKEIKNKQFSYNIYSLNSSQNNSSIFVLGTDTFKSNDYYYFFIKDKKFNGFRKEKIPVTETLLLEKDTIAHLVKNYYYEKRIAKDLFSEDKVTELKKDYDYIFYEIPKYVEYKYILVVPIGTVTENQNITK